jgi:hypothetical protein
MRIGCLARTRTYEKPHAGLAPDGAPSQLASQADGTTVHDGTQVMVDSELKEVLANWTILPPSIRQAIVVIIRLKEVAMWKRTLRQYGSVILALRSEEKEESGGCFENTTSMTEQ